MEIPKNISPGRETEAYTTGYNDRFLRDFYDQNYGMEYVRKHVLPAPAARVIGLAKKIQGFYLRGCIAGRLARQKLKGGLND